VIALVAKGFLGPAAEAPLDPDVAAVVPSAPTLTVYDQEHLVTYLRLLDADGADWCEIADRFAYRPGSRVRSRETCV
jgi:hypothetical protein